MISIAGLPASIIVLIAVFVLIAVRQIGNVRLKIWQIMLGGAVAVLLLGEISPQDALYAINLDVMFFLFGMFVVGEALSQSGYLAHLSFKMFRRAKNVDQLILSILFVIGFFSAILMNDTLAIIGTPLMLMFARKHNISNKLLLLTLAIAVTTGSVMSPIGNPQNLLIALNGGIANPFVTFFRYLLLPTVVNLFLAFLMLRIFFRDEFHDNSLNHSDEPVKDPKLASLVKISLVLIIALIALKISFVLLSVHIEIRLTYIALISAAPIILFSRKRLEVVKRIDWATLVFFAAMFVLMQSVWQSMFFQEQMEGVDVLSVPVILLVSVGMSQLVSNVPFVALYLPLMTYAGATDVHMMALAAGSTIAGNMLILGAASNVIIIQNAERENATLTFFEFARVGIPLTLLNVFVYWVFLSI
jgi:Na+/H+ antiporter NhaD/arsenite permease-like protein